jgi:hypothetical protein
VRSSVAAVDCVELLELVRLGEPVISSSRPRTGSERRGGLGSRAVGRGRREAGEAPGRPT